MNNENNIQNQNNNSVNNNLEPTLEMFDFGEPVNNQNNNLFEAPAAPVQQQNQNITAPLNNQVAETPVLNQVTETFEVSPVTTQEQPTLTSNESQQENNNFPEIEVLDIEPSVEMPVIQPEQIVLDNEKKKQSSDAIIIVIVIIMIIGVFYIDNIIAFVQDNILQTSPSGVIDASSDNLYEGFIKINEQGSGITLDKLVRFYNFKKVPETYSIGLNYKTLKDVKNITEKGYYIEFYNIDKKVLYKELLTKEEKHTQDSVYTYDIILDNNIFEEVVYAQVKKYEENELNKLTKLNCIYKVSNAGYNELYKHNYTFKNDMLISYDVDKFIEFIDANNASAKKAKLEIQNEYDRLTNLEIPATYENEKLVYSINLEEVTTSYIPLYKKGTTSQVIKDREEYLKWECE